MKSEGAGHKTILIILLCVALGLFLYIRPQLFAPEPPPTILDRLPKADIIGRFNILETAKEAQSLMFKNKVPMREYFTSDFLLSQAKGMGIDIQSNGYFFSNGESEWGTIVPVIDSSRILSGFERLEQYFSIKDTIVFSRKVKKVDQFGLYIYYDNDFLLIYQGNKIRNRMARVLYAVKDGMEETWKNFLNHQTFAEEKNVLYSNAEELKSFGVDYALFAYDSDSLNVKLKTYIHSNKGFSVKPKASGISFKNNVIATKSLELHLDITEFRKQKMNPLYQWIVKKGRKIGFPTELFFETWEGDLALQEGGMYFINEEIVEMTYDEEFNPIEKKSKVKVPVPGYSIMLSVNNNSKRFINTLFAKGIVTKQDKHFRFLFSPPLNLNITKSSIQAYTTPFPPKIITGTQSRGLWKYKGTDVHFQIDSLKSHDAYGSLEFGVANFVRRGKVF
jgi:hypothetical protein